LTKHRTARYGDAVTVDQAAEVIQFAYPQVYYACHTRHARIRSHAVQLSHRDAQILVHLDRERPTTLTTLASHLGLSASTTSEAVAHLAGLSLLRKTRLTTDRRAVGVCLTAAGVAAVRSESVLETPRLRAVLQRLSPRDRASTVRAFARLAAACRPSIARSWHDEAADA
jgi:DNA-binding MarR family transcriptional regulator